MLMQKMRDGAQGIVAKVIIGLLVFVLAAFGFGTIDLFSVSEPVAATVNGDEVSQGDLEVAIARQRSILRAQMGENATDDLLDRMVTPGAVLNVLVDQTLLAQAADDLDLAVSERRVESRIRADFAGLVELDETSYRQRLAAAGYTPLTYQAELVDTERQSQLAGGFRETGFVTERELRRAAEVLTQRRDVAWLPLEAASFEGEVEVEEAEIEDRYLTEIQSYMTEEMFDFSFVRLARGALEAEVDVTDEEVVQRYEAEAAALAEKPPRRRGAHILFEVGGERDAEAALALAAGTRARLDAGEAFEDLARELSEDIGSAADGGDLGMADRDTFVAPFADALWALEPDELSEPVESEFGVHLIKLLEVEEVLAPTLEERRDGIAAELRAQAAEELFTERLRELDEVAFENPESLEPLAEEFALTVERAPGVTRASLEGVLADRAVRDAAFGDEVLAQGFNSRAVATANDEAVVVRLDTRYPAEERPFEEVRDEIRAELVREQARFLAQDAAEAALAEFRAGAATAAIADRYASAWERADAAERRTPDAPQEILDAAFALAAPAEGRVSDVAVMADGSRALVVVSAVNLGDFGALNDSDRAGIRVNLADMISARAVDALIGTLKTDADIDTVSFAADE